MRRAGLTGVWPGEARRPLAKACGFISNHFAMTRTLDAPPDTSPEAPPETPPETLRNSDPDPSPASVPDRRVGQLGQFLPYQLSIASNAVSGLIAERYRRRFGLKITEWRVMAVLGDQDAAAPRRGMTQRALAQATLMDKVAVNRACKVLEGRGLITRAPHAADGRSHLMVLTPQGLAIHAEIMPLALATQEELFAGFSKPDQLRLRTMLEALRARAAALSHGPEV